MKLTILTLAIYFISIPTFAAVVTAKPISLAGSLKHCVGLEDEGVVGFNLKHYRSYLDKNILYIQVLYTNIECQLTDNQKMRFKPVPLKDAFDRLIFESPIGVFNSVVQGVSLNWIGYGVATYQNDLSKILSVSDYNDYQSGKSVKKAFYIFYGNFFGDNIYDWDKYARSVGYGILELKIQNGLAEVNSFSQEQSK